MFKLSKQVSRFRLMSTMIIFADLLFASTVSAQSVPASPDHAWHGPIAFNMEAYTRNAADSRLIIDQSKTYSLAELIDLAESHNPATRVAWEQARSQAAALGIARSELYPTLAAAALSRWLVRQPL